MSRQEDIKVLLKNCNRRLQMLKERKASFGLDTPVAILTEIQDIEAEIEKLQTELAEIENNVSPPSEPTLDKSDHVNDKSQMVPQAGERDFEARRQALGPDVIGEARSLYSVLNKVTSIRVLVIFPFALGIDQEKDKTLKVLKHILDGVQDPQIGLHTSQARPVLYVNRISQEKGLFKEIEDYLQSDQHRNKWDIVTGWSVDTCQDWLFGWGKVIDDWRKDNQGQDSLGLLQIPGDLTDVGDSDDLVSIRRFLSQLRQLAALVKGGDDFVIGDYKTRRVGGKYLIDAYGTFPLLYNWFPDVARQIRTELYIERPRSEFIAANINFLKTMIVNHRRFAYEQTTALLINAHFYADMLQKELGHKPLIRKVDLGEIQDHTGARGFREAVEQLERMERMMRLLWRVLHGGDEFDVDKYSILDERSSAIRSAAMVTFRNFLRPT